MLKFFKDKFWLSEKIPNTKYTRSLNIILVMIPTIVTGVDYSELAYNIHLPFLITFSTYLWTYNHIIITLLSNKEFFKDEGLRSKFINSTILIAIIFFIITMSMYIFRAFYLRR